jgi:hypothetical protein
VRPFLGPHALFRSARQLSSVARRAFWIGRSTVASRKTPGSGGHIADCLDAQSEPGGAATAQGSVTGDWADKRHRVAASLTRLFLRNVKFVRQTTSCHNTRQGVSDRCIAPQTGPQHHARCTVGLFCRSAGRRSQPTYFTKDSLFRGNVAKQVGRSAAASVGRNKRSALRRIGVDGTGIAGSRRITLR